jgi:TRAP-type mannitol/chloroaromatic compound transport system permease small subunit
MIGNSTVRMAAILQGIDDMDEIVARFSAFLAIQLILVTLIVVAKRMLLPPGRGDHPGQRRKRS